MGFARSIKSVYVVSPLCFATAVFGCKSKDNGRAWEEALDASAQGTTKTNQTPDAGGGQTSTDKPQTTANDSTQDTSSAPTLGSSTAVLDAGVTGGEEPMPGDPNDASDNQSSTEVSSDTSSTTPPPSNNGDCGDYLLCETFEDVADGEVPEGWQRRGGAQLVGVTSEQAFGGERSLKIGATPAGQRRIVRDASVLGSSHWGRLYYKVALPVPDNLAHSTLVALSGTAPAAGPSEFRVIDTIKIGKETPDIGGKHNWAYNVQPDDGSESTCETLFEWEFDGEWHCVEYHVDASTQTYQIFYEGEELDLVQGGGCGSTDLPDQFDELRVGWNNYQDAPPGFTAYIDNIAFDDERIGCD